MIMATAATPLNHGRAPRTRPRLVQTILFERAAWLAPSRVRTDHVFGHTTMQAADVPRVKDQRRVLGWRGCRRHRVPRRSVTSTPKRRGTRCCSVFVSRLSGDRRASHGASTLYPCAVSLGSQQGWHFPYATGFHERGLGARVNRVDPRNKQRGLTCSYERLEFFWQYHRNSVSVFPRRRQTGLSSYFQLSRCIVGHWPYRE